jgi:hypothetical protein
LRRIRVISLLDFEGEPWSAAIRRSSASGRWLAAIPLVLMSAMYARFFHGFWLGDDFGFLHQAWLASADGNLWVQTWAQFFAVASDGVVFYRPMMIASVALNEWIAGATSRAGSRSTI